MNQFLRSHAGAPGGARALADALEVEPGCELALAAALDGRLRAAIADDHAAATSLLDRAGDDGGSVLVTARLPPAAPLRQPASPRPRRPARLRRTPAPRPSPGPALSSTSSAVLPTRSPSPRPCFADAWLVEELRALPDGFTGIAVTRSGRVWFGAWRELRQVPAGGADRVLAQRNRRHSLVAASEAAANAEHRALAAAREAAQHVSAADGEREAAERALRQAQREHDSAAEARRRAGWLIDQRRTAPDEGPGSLRRAQLAAELQAERRLAQRIEAERAQRERRIARAEAAAARDEALAPAATRLADALAAAARRSRSACRL